MNRCIYIYIHRTTYSGSSSCSSSGALTSPVGGALGRPGQGAAVRAGRDAAAATAAAAVCCSMIKYIYICLHICYMIVEKLASFFETMLFFPKIFFETNGFSFAE